MDDFDVIEHLAELRGVQAQTLSNRSAAEWDATFKVGLYSSFCSCFFSLFYFICHSSHLLDILPSQACKAAHKLLGFAKNANSVEAKKEYVPY